MAELLDRQKVKKPTEPVERDLGASSDVGSEQSHLNVGSLHDTSSEAAQSLLHPEDPNIDDSNSMAAAQKQTNSTQAQAEERVISAEEEELRVFKIFSIAAIFGIPALTWIVFNVIF